MVTAVLPKAGAPVLSRTDATTVVPLRKYTKAFSLFKVHELVVAPEMVVGNVGTVIVAAAEFATGHEPFCTTARYIVVVVSEGGEYVVAVLAMFVHNPPPFTDCCQFNMVPVCPDNVSIAGLDP